MSTRTTLYNEPDGVHIYVYLFDEEEADLFLEYRCGGFLLDLPLSKAFSGIIKAGLRDLATKMNAYTPQTAQTVPAPATPEATKERA
jgi:hypothetical protein